MLKSREATLFWRVAGKALDALVAPSYGAPGFRVHSKTWSGPPAPENLEGRRYVVTGGNAGIGRATVEMLAARNADVHMVCRSRQRGEAAREELIEATENDRLHLHVCDVSDLAAVREFALDLVDDIDQLDALVHNAGVLVHDRQETAQGLELTFAVHVAGPFLMTQLLLPLLTAGPTEGRTIFVSSGGMYTQKLDVRRLFDPPGPFDGVLAYAMAKRAQVVLAREFASRTPNRTRFASMHPGWVDTGGVKRSLPGFYRATKWFLRTPKQGADTIVWLASSPGAADIDGEFYFDREARAEHLPFSDTAADATAPMALWELLLGVTRRFAHSSGAESQPADTTKSSSSNVEQL